MKKLKVLITLFFTLALWSSVGRPQAEPVDPFTTIELNTSMHFLAPDGSHLLIVAGTYAVELAEEWQ